MMFAAFDMTSMILALLGILVLWFTFKRLGRRRTKSSNPVPVSRSVTSTPQADLHHLDAPASVARWEVAMHETARDLMGRLDSKIVIVNQLVRDARQAAAQLEALLLQIEQAKGRPDPSDAKSVDREADPRFPADGTIPAVPSGNAPDT